MGVWSRRGDSRLVAGGPALHGVTSGRGVEAGVIPRGGAGFLGSGLKDPRTGLGGGRPLDAR